MSLMSSNIQFLINRHGQTATLVKNTYSAYDPTTGTTGSPTGVSYTVKAYFADYSLGDVNGQTIQLGDRKVYLPAKDTSGASLPLPDVEDEITGVGDTVKILRVQQIYNADNLVCYVCQVRE